MVRVIRVRPGDAETVRCAKGLDAAMTYLEEHFTEAPTLAELAGVAGLSLFHFQRMFQLRFGSRPKTVETSLRVDLAKRLMLDGLSMPEVAKRCGFLYQSHFIMRFKAATGQTPGAWLRGERRPHPAD